MMNLELTGKHALVCGSSRGIGRAIARELASLGASVTLLARDQSLLEQVLVSLDTSKGQQHDILIADLQDPSRFRQALDSHLSQIAPTHILVNNTGGPPPGMAHTSQIEDYVAAFSQHLLCNQILVQRVLDGMKQSHYGRIINIISTSVKQPIPGLGVSNTIRGAVANWSKTLAKELGAFGITVNNVLPGATKTERLEQIFQNKAAKLQKSVPEIEEMEKQSIPLGRFAEPEELANAVAFLASPAAAYITGINLPVDGGRTQSL